MSREENDDCKKKNLTLDSLIKNCVLLYASFGPTLLWADL